MKKLFNLLVLVIPFTLGAQSFEIGISGGISFYNGDLSSIQFEDYLETIHGAYGGFFKYHPSERFAFRVGVIKARVSGDDQIRMNTQRNLNFESDILEFHGMVDYKIASWGPSAGNFQVTPFLSGGLAVFTFDPRTYFNEQWIDLQPLGTEGQGLEGYEEPYSLTQLAIPFGGGLRFIFSDRVAITAEIGGRKLFTDYLDDVGSTPVIYQEVFDGNGELAATLSNPLIVPESVEAFESYQRGNSPKDWYYTGTLSVSLLFGGEGRAGGKGPGNVKCYEF